MGVFFLNTEIRVTYAWFVWADEKRDGRVEKRRYAAVRVFDCDCESGRTASWWIATILINKHHAVK